MKYLAEIKDRYEVLIKVDDEYWFREGNYVTSRKKESLGEIFKLTKENVDKIISGYKKEIAQHDEVIEYLNKNITTNLVESEQKRLADLILKNCERINDGDIIEFENRLKEICKLKKYYYSIENLDKKETRSKIKMFKRSIYELNNDIKRLEELMK